MKRLGIGLLTLVLWATYLVRAAPTITIGDSGELAAVGSTLGIAHSPGYPVYSLLTTLGTRALPFGTGAYRVNVQSAFWTAACVGLIALSILQLTGSLSIALLTGAFIAWTPLWMNQALVSEVFALNSFFAALLFFIALQSPSPQKAALAAFVLGVGLGNHHTLILLSPALIIAFWPVIRKQPVQVSGDVMLWLLLGLSVYLFIPVRAHQLPVMNWEEPATWERFWKLITRARYGSFQLAQGSLPAVTWSDGVMQFRYVATVLIENFGPAVLMLVLTLFPGWQTDLRSTRLMLLCAFLFAGPFFFIWTHLTVTPRTRAILDRFMYLPLVPAGLLIGLGLSEALRFTKRFRLPEAIVVLILAVAPFSWAYFQPPPYERNNFYVRDLGRDILRSCPVGTLLFADRADEAEFSIAYLQRVEHRRRDITFVDCNAGVSPSIYGPGYYDIWGRPRLAIRTAEERAQIRTWHGPVYYATQDPDMIPIPRVQEGLVFVAAVQPPTRPRLPWQELLIFRKPEMKPGRRLSTDRGMYGNYWQLLYQDSVRTHAR